MRIKTVMDRRVILLPFLAVVAVVLAGALWHFGDLAAHRNAESVATGETVNIGGPFKLIDQDGATRTDQDYRGKYVLVFFGYTYCPDVCPTTLAVMKSALDMMGSRAADIVPLFVTVDPKRDTPAKLKSYLSS